MKQPMNTHKDNINNEKQALSLSKKILFSLIILSIPLIIFTLIEFSLRLAKYGETFPLFYETTSQGVTYKMCNPNYGKKYFYKLTHTQPPNDRFLKEKKENTFRIFVLGSSTVVGFPYNSGIMFSRILHERLQDTYPLKNIEMVNIAITAINSYTFYDRIEEILKEEPDAILIYAGHNEFYGAMGIASKEGLGEMRALKRMHLKMLDLRTYQWLRNIISKAGSLASSKGQEENSETATLMQRIVSNKDIEYQSPKYKLALSHYKKNMQAVIEKAQKKNVPVFLSDLVAIVKDQAPFGSTKNGKYPPANEVFNEAVELERKGDYNAAKEKYYLAKDLDCIRFRASEELNAIIEELASKNKAHFVPMKKAFQQHSANELIGHNLLTEHVHPNIDGYFIMADAFFNKITTSGVLGNIGASVKPSSYYRENWGYTQVDSMLAYLRIRQLTGGWPFKSDTIVNEFIYNYQPQNMIDSLAIMDLRYDDITITITHKKLASFYLQEGNISKAADEYFALSKINPYNFPDIFEAGNLYLKCENYERALKLFTQAYKLNPEPVVLLKLAECNYHLDRFKEAISQFEKVKMQESQLFSQESNELLKKSYEAIGAQYTESEIDKKLPSKNKEQLILNTSSKTKESIQAAIALFKARKFDEALKTLYKANEIEETSIANRLIGEILLNQEKPEALPYLKKAYHQYSSDPNFLNTLCYASMTFNDPVFAKKMLSELKQIAPHSEKIVLFEEEFRKRGIK
jgi:tetratricopeptide (TPR) repeat protein/lysophospholipase L1-like esterase